MTARISTIWNSILGHVLTTSQKQRTGIIGFNPDARGSNGRVIGLLHIIPTTRVIR